MGKEKRPPLEGKAIRLCVPDDKRWPQNAGFSRGWAICLDWNGIHYRAVAGHSFAGEHRSPLQRHGHTGWEMDDAIGHAIHPTLGLPIADLLAITAVSAFAWK